MGTDVAREMNLLLNPRQVVELTCDVQVVEELKKFILDLGNAPFKVVVCGGDGTIRSVLEALQEVKHEDVPVALLPLGTGNDLSYVLGWGRSLTVEPSRFLEEVSVAAAAKLDVWRYECTEAAGETANVHVGHFNNYLDVGVAARIVSRFHVTRERYRGRYIGMSQLVGKMLYFEACVRDLCEYMTRQSPLIGCQVWCDGQRVDLPCPIEGLILVNIKSFAGGMELWNWRDNEKRSSSGSEKSNNSSNAPAATATTAAVAGGAHKINNNNNNSTDKLSGGSGDALTVGASAVGGSIAPGRVRLSRSSSQPAVAQESASTLATLSAPSHHSSPADVSAATPSPSAAMPVAPSPTTTTTATPTATAAPRRPSWRPPSFSDKLLEVVAVRSLLHLGLIWTGLAKPIRLCQGKDITI